MHHGKNWGDDVMIMMLFLMSIIIYYYMNTFIAILVKKSVISNVRIVDVDEKNRCLAVLITFHGNFKLLVVDVYLPCSEPGQEYQTTLLHCLGFIENCIVANDYNAVMVLGFNK